MTTGPADALSGRQLIAWRNAIFVIFAVSGTAVASWISRLSAIRDTLGASTFAMGLLLLGMAVASISGTVSASVLLNRFGPAASIRLALAIAGAGLAVLGGAAAASSFAAAVAGYAIFGYGLGTCDVAMNVDGARSERRLSKPVMPLFHAVYSCGTIAGAAAGATAEYLRVPVAAHFAVAGAGLVLSGALAVRYLPPGDPRPPETAGTHSWLAPWRHRRTALIGIFVLTMALSEGAASDWLGLAMVDGYDTSRTAGALVYGIFVTTMTVGRVGGVYLLRRWGRVPVLRGSAILAAMGLAIVIGSPFAWLAALGAALWGLGTAVGFPTGISAAADDSAHAATNVSAVAATGYIAFLAGPPVIGALGQQTGLLSALSVVFVAVLVAGVVAGAAREPKVNTGPGN